MYRIQIKNKEETAWHYTGQQFSEIFETEIKVEVIHELYEARRLLATYNTKTKDKVTAEIVEI